MERVKGHSQIDHSEPSGKGQSFVSAHTHPVSVVCFSPQVEVVPSAASLIIKALKEPPRDRKKVKHSELLW